MVVAQKPATALTTIPRVAACVCSKWFSLNRIYLLIDQVGIGGGGSGPTSRGLWGPRLSLVNTALLDGRRH